MIIPLGFTQFTWTFGGDAAPNGAVITMGVEISNASDQITNATTAYQAFQENVLPLLVTTINLTGVISKDGPNETGSQVTYSESDAGGSGSNAVPPNTSLLVQKQTALGGRKNRGRMFLPGYREDQVGGNGIVSDPSGNLQSGLTAFFGDLEAADMQPVLFHSDSTTPTPIVALNLTLLAATQRRRMRR